jgi:cyclopropane fatty-acyl-phospholipid synthase-like methyltransferase
VNRKLTVSHGYDKIAAEYLAWRERTAKEHIIRWLDLTTEGVPQGARVLDLGCGAGVPYAQHLSERFDVVGLDISSGQLAFARKLVPRASFARADMSSLPLRAASVDAGSFDAIVALYSIIHVPREQHAALFAELRALLRPGRRLLAVLGQDEWEASESDWLVEGVEMSWSHYDAKTNLRLMAEARLRVVESDVVPDPLGGSHLFVVAERFSH